MLGKALKTEVNMATTGSLESVGWLNQWSDKPLAIPDVEKMLADNFSQHLQIQWEHSEPTSIELMEAEKMRIDKFGHPDWNLKR